MYKAFCLVNFISYCSLKISNQNIVFIISVVDLQVCPDNLLTRIHGLLMRFQGSYLNNSKLCETKWKQRRLTAVLFIAITSLVVLCNLHDNYRFVQGLVKVGRETWLRCLINVNNLFTVILGLCYYVIVCNHLGKLVNFCVDRNESCLGDLSNRSFQTLKGATMQGNSFGTIGYGCGTKCLIIPI